MIKDKPSGMLNKTRKLDANETLASCSVFQIEPCGLASASIPTHKAAATAPDAEPGELSREGGEGVGA